MSRGRRGGKITVAVLAAIVLAGLGVGGTWAWGATAVWRTCALQPRDVAAITGWQPTSSTSSTAPAPFTNVDCTYIDRTSGGRGSSSNLVTITTGGTEASTTPGKPQRCVKGGFWGGVGYACQDSAGVGDILDPTAASISLTGVRLSGTSTYAAHIVCVEQVTPGTPLPQQLRERCLQNLTALMGAVARKLDVPDTAGAKQEPVDLDKVTAAAADAEGGTTGQPTDQPTPVLTDSRQPTPETPAQGVSTPVTPTPDAGATPTPPRRTSEARPHRRRRKRP
ncbi:hypothetical protein [Terracoccus luteus]|uniref:Uncharacterized protein n=1 Tax=Terracoccus luteus TaxID=53356 RepID=A0A839Q0L3_9MICO|nr:hypothetical protein [Terracoccus luteus]MBB2988504.1 hypothetical protein [Terracoccus luteus]MCP2174149.1 hypothetical protein [Terracoccus luteus]